MRRALSRFHPPARMPALGCCGIDNAIAQGNRAVGSARDHRRKKSEERGMERRCARDFIAVTLPGGVQERDEVFLEFIPIV